MDPNARPSKQEPIHQLDARVGGQPSQAQDILKRIESLANQLQHNCTEMQDTAWQPGVPELAEQMGNTVSNLLSEISKLREELVASDGRVQKLNVENERLRQLATSVPMMPMMPRPPMPNEMVMTTIPTSSVPQQQQALQSPPRGSNSAVAAAAGSGGASTAGTTVSPSSSSVNTGTTTATSSSQRNSSSNDAISNNICEVCCATFKSRQTLLQHRHIHDPSPRFSCQLCGNKFRQQSGLYQHMRVVHRKN